MKKPGPRRLAGEEKRTHCISVRVNEAELERLDEERGNFKRGEWLRWAWLKSTPPPPPPALNRQAWVELARAAANLNQISRRANFNSASVLEIMELKSTLDDFRRALIGAARGEDESQD